MTRSSRWFVIFAFATALFGGRAFAQPTPAPAGSGTATTMVAGVIKAANVQGDVRKVQLADNVESPVANGDVLTQYYAIVTGANSSVVLVFANGSTVRVGNDSRLEISEFLMDPLQSDLTDVASLTGEPTISKTNLRLEFGEIVGNVKTLNRAAGSSFQVATPAGAAGIRGTTFRIVFRPTGDGRAFTFSLSTAEGVVLFEGTTTVGPAAQLDVPQNQEVVVTAQVDAATNTLTVNTPTATVPISTEATVQFQAVTAAIVQAQTTTTITRVELQTAVPPPPPPPPPPPTPPAPQPQQQQTPPVQQQQPPRTTTGDGRNP